MALLSPSMLAADFNCLGEQINLLEKAKITHLHIDVMDGMFVPSISYGMPVISSIRKNTNLQFDVHLMIEEPIRYIEEFVKAGANSITIHVESCKNVVATIREIKKFGIKAGITSKPGTPLEMILPYMDKVDMLLIMSVEPGFGGQTFMKESLEKIRFMRKYIDERNLFVMIEVDGGINLSNVKSVKEAGCDIIVAGTAIFEGDILSNIKALEEE